MPAQLALVDAALPVPAAFATATTGDLSLRSGDPAVPANRERLGAELGLDAASLVFAEQVHGAGVATVARPEAAAVPGVDALVTATPGLGLVVLAADCMPVLLADPDAGVVGAAHAGRPGLVAGVLGATVAAMRALGASTISATIGPCIGGCCYELPADLADAVAREVPPARSTTTWGTPSIDLRSGGEHQLREAGAAAVHHVGGCTHEQPERWSSYRRDGTLARHGGVVRLP